MKFVVAIDGTAASGKGTLGLAASKYFNFKYLDTGLLYRAVAFKLMDFFPDINKISEKILNLTIDEIDSDFLLREELTTNRIGEKASRLAVLPAVRSGLLNFQRTFARQEGGVILDGRDIGSVVCPEADVKFFVDAELSIRSKRRFEQSKIKGFDVSYEKVFQELKKRDERDKNRKSSPMVPTFDAFLIDSSNLSKEACEQIVIREINAQLQKMGLNS